MPVISAFSARSAQGGRLSPFLSDDMSAFSGVIGWPPAYDGAQSRLGLAAMATAYPVEANGRGISAFAPGGFAADFYNRIHVRPLAIDAGIVASDRLYPAFVWNAHFTSRALASITTPEGVTVSGISAPGDLQGLEERAVVITVLAETGPAKIEGAAVFNFTGETVLPILLSGSRGLPWPFLPRSELIEACVWKTDVQDSYDTEIRACLRDIPLREFSLTHIASEPLQAQARKLARGVRTVLVPEWPRQIIGDAYEGAAVALPDGPVLIWRSETDYDQTTVTGGIMGTLNVRTDNVRIIPLLVSRITAPWGNNRPAGRWAEMSLGIQTADGADDSSAALYPTYLGISLMTDRVVIGSGAADEGVSWENDTIDNELALPVDVRARGYAEQTYTVAWYKSRADYPALRAWIHSRRGRWLPFWLPSWTPDVRNPSRIGATILADSYDVQEPHLAILIGGTIYPRAVVSAAFIGSQWQIQIDTAAPAGAIDKIMYLRKVRFNADRIEFRHAAAQGVSVAVQCVQVPE